LKESKEDTGRQIRRRNEKGRPRWSWMDKSHWTWGVCK